MSIDTNISLTENEVFYYKEFENLSVNEQPLAQGDSIIRISPFDDYILFIVYNDEDGNNTPIDLSNVGTVFLVFVGENDEIRIPNFTDVKDVDISSGQVIFRLSAEDSKKILALNNDNFYISSKMEDPNGDSDESVIYSGKFLPYTEEAAKSLTQQLEDLRVEYARKLAEKDKEINSKESIISEQIEVINKQNVALDALRQSNENLLNELDNLPEEVQKELQEEATSAQRKEEEAKDKKEKVDDKGPKTTKDTLNDKPRSYWENMARDLESMI